MLVAVPKSDLPQLISDKQAHFIIFFGITLLCSRWMRNNYGVSALLWLAGFGLLLEFMQWLVPLMIMLPLPLILLRYCEIM